MGDPRAPFFDLEQFQRLSLNPELRPNDRPNKPENPQQPPNQYYAPPYPPFYFPVNVQPYSVFPANEAVGIPHYEAPRPIVPNQPVPCKYLSQFEKDELFGNREPFDEKRRNAIVEDEKLALQLQNEELQRIKKREVLKASTLDDEKLARQLFEEEKRSVEEEQRLKSERSQIERDSQDALERAKQKTVQIKKDEELARRLFAEEKKNKLLEEDAELARKLEESERKSKIIAKPYAFDYVPPLDINQQKRQHAITIHDRFCNCSNRQLYNNNHILSLHAQNCGCTLIFSEVQPSIEPRFSGVAGNAGKGHVHNWKCCQRNHYHGEACYCAYEKHEHSGLCCTLNHVHNKYCHCTDK